MNDILKSAVEFYKGNENNILDSSIKKANNTFYVGTRNNEEERADYHLYLTDKDGVVHPVGSHVWKTHDPETIEGKIYFYLDDTVVYANTSEKWADIAGANNLVCDDKYNIVMSIDSYPVYHEVQEPSLSNVEIVYSSDEIIKGERYYTTKNPHRCKINEDIIPLPYSGIDWNTLARYTDDITIHKDYILYKGNMVKPDGTYDYEVWSDKPDSSVAYKAENIPIDFSIDNNQYTFEQTLWENVVNSGKIEGLTLSTYNNVWLDEEGTEHPGFINFKGVPIVSGTDAEGNEVTVLVGSQVDLEARVYKSSVQGFTLDATYYPVPISNATWAQYIDYNKAFVLNKENHIECKITNSCICKELQMSDNPSDEEYINNYNNDVFPRVDDVILSSTDKFYSTSRISVAYVIDTGSNDITGTRDPHELVPEWPIGMLFALESDISYGNIQEGDYYYAQFTVNDPIIGPIEVRHMYYELQDSISDHIDNNAVVFTGTY